VAIERKDIIEVLAQHKLDYQRMKDTFGDAKDRAAAQEIESEVRYMGENEHAARMFAAAIASVILALNEREPGIVDEISNVSIDIRDRRGLK
jgi:hypothetical protein